MPLLSLCPTITTSTFLVPHASGSLRAWSLCSCSLLPQVPCAPGFLYVWSPVTLVPNVLVPITPGIPGPQCSGRHCPGSRCIAWFPAYLVRCDPGPQCPGPLLSLIRCVPGIPGSHCPGPLCLCDPYVPGSTCLAYFV